MYRLRLGKQLSVNSYDYDEALKRAYMLARIGIEVKIEKEK